jgi:D-alanyl-D-alanine carboxypeptidase
MPILAACRRPPLLLLTLLALLLAEPGHGQDHLAARTRSDAATSPHNARFQSLLDAAVSHGLPGVSLRVKGPGIDFQGAAGVANLVTGEPLTINHVMYVASLGKTFTATVALQLCDEGRLDLEAPMTTWLPREVTKRIPSSGNITLRQLLSHTSGLVDYLNDDTGWRSDFDGDPHKQWTHSEIVSYLYDKPLLFAPGSNYHYSNSNYVLVGMILEQVSGQPLHTLISNRILAPLGLHHTFNGREPVGGGKHAHGYIRRCGRVIDTYPWYGHYGLADAGIHSTPGDLAVFLKSLFTSEDILSETMRSEMTHVSSSGHPGSRYGLGIYVQQNAGGAGPWYSHDGIDPGYQAAMMYGPDLNLTVVLSANASLGKADVIYEKLITAVVRTALDAVQENRR